MSSPTQIIGIAGIKEKRHILLSIIRLMGSVDRIAIISQDRSLKFLSPDMSNSFNVGDVDVQICDGPYELLDDEEDEEGILGNLNSYNYVIFDIVDEIPSGVNKLVITDNEEFYLQSLQDNDVYDIDIIASEKSFLLANFRSGIVYKFPQAWQFSNLLNDMIDSKKLTVIKDKNLDNAARDVVANILGVSAASVNAMKSVEVEL